MSAIELGKYIIAMPPTSSPSGKTKEWVIQSFRGGLPLGKIRWFGRWRCYSFFPSPSTIFNAACMDELSAFCSKATKEHKPTAQNTGEQITD